MPTILINEEAAFGSSDIKSFACISEVNHFYKSAIVFLQIFNKIENCIMFLFLFSLKLEPDS